MKTLTTSMHVWNGEQSRPVRVQRPCLCGCDLREGPLATGEAVGYITGSTPEGEGLTIYLPDEQSFVLAQRLFGGAL